jgi:hypothetical protein
VFSAHAEDGWRHSCSSRLTLLRLSFSEMLGHMYTSLEMATVGLQALSVILHDQLDISVPLVLDSCQQKYACLRASENLIFRGRSLVSCTPRRGPSLPCRVGQMCHTDERGLTSQVVYTSTPDEPDWVLAHLLTSFVDLPSLASLCVIHPGRSVVESMDMFALSRRFRGTMIMRRTHRYKICPLRAQEPLREALLPL